MEEEEGSRGGAGEVDGFMPLAPTFTALAVISMPWVAHGMRAKDDGARASGAASGGLHGVLRKHSGLHGLSGADLPVLGRAGRPA